MNDIEQLHELERAWVRDRALSGEILDDTVRSTYGYALRLACAETLRAADGSEIRTTPALDAFRWGFAQNMLRLSDDGWHYPVDHKALNGVGTLSWTGKWHRQSLVEFYPTLAKMLYEAICSLYRQNPNLDQYALQDAFQTKALALALGGGGGTGYAHICLFQWLEENGIRPELITGTSFGALLGYMRAMQTQYDAAMTMLRLPGFWRLINNIRPCLDTGTHGLMGLCSIDFNELSRELSLGAGYADPPAFADLKIPFAAVSSGIQSKAHIARKIEPKGSNILSGLMRLTQFTWNKSMRHASQIASLIMSHRESVTPVVFGFDAETRNMTAADGVAFSALVPGVINAEIPAHHRQSREIMNALFKKRSLYRLADGGLTSNVPVRAAKAEIMRGRLRTKNTWIVGIDVFAPQHGDGIFYPLQQIANENAVEDAKEADSFVRLKYLLSPMELVPSLERMHWLNSKFRKTFDDEMKVIRYAVKPLSPIAALDLIGF